MDVSALAQRVEVALSAEAPKYLNDGSVLSDGSFRISGAVVPSKVPRWLCSAKDQRARLTVGGEIRITSELVNLT
jgi:hypothetical protein